MEQVRDEKEQWIESAEESAIERWSRRKLAAGGRSQHAGSSEAAPAPGASRAAECPPPTDPEMPPLEDLTVQSDLSPFFSPGVSEDLRLAALRQVFGLPAYNLTDGLDDYAEDYRVYRPLGDLVTQALRRHRERLTAAGRASTGEQVSSASSEQAAMPQPAMLETETPDDPPEPGRIS
jgi:hypothetical protein